MFSSGRGRLLRAIVSGAVRRPRFTLPTALGCHTFALSYNQCINCCKLAGELVEDKWEQTMCYSECIKKFI